MKIILCTVVDDVSGRRSVGVGKTEGRALDDALLHFPDLTKRRTQEMIRKRAAIYYETRALQ